MNWNKRSVWAILLCMVMLFIAVSCNNGAASEPAEANEENIPKDFTLVEESDENGNVQKKYVKYAAMTDPDLEEEIKSDNGKPWMTAFEITIVEVKDSSDKLHKKYRYVKYAVEMDPETETPVTDESGKVVKLSEEKQMLFVEEKDQKEVETSKDWKYYILMPVGWFLAQINKIVPSYIFTLFVFAILMKLLFLWFSIKQHKNMIKQANFKPTERAIRNRYKGRTDQATMQKMQQEIMDAQKKAGVSTFGGCLPMLIQLPIIFLLYEVIRTPLKYVANYAESTITGIKNVLCYNDVSFLKLENISSTVKNALATGNAAGLSELDLVPILRDNWSLFGNVAGMADKSEAGLPNFFAFGNYVDLSVQPETTLSKGWPMILYLLIPIITFVALFFSMRLNRKMTAGATAAPMEGQPDMRVANLVMDIGMPAMSAFFAFKFPAVLGIYWIFNNVLSTLQQFILKKIYPFPTFTEEDYKQAEREYNKGKEVVKREKGPSDPNKPKVRSLHHIDDDDDE